MSLVVSACGTPALSSDVAATVNGEMIPMATVESYVASQFEGSELGRPAPEEYEEAAHLQRQILSQLIEDEIKAQAATALGVTVSQQRIDDEWDVLAEQFGGDESLRDEIDRRGLTVDEVRRQLASFIREQLLGEYFMEQVDLDPEAIQRAYQERRDSEFRVAVSAHILVETEQEAEEILAELEDGADFAELAAERSIDEGSAVRGGELGEARRGQFVEPFDSAVWEAEEGEIVGPVETQFGYHVIEVREFRETPLVDVEDRLREELAGRDARNAFDAWLAEAFADAEVEVSSRIGEWDAARGGVVGRDVLGREPAGPRDE
jgi:parvulin-like peptidyl-prolyl isomerase